jgi:hypothetical protein
VFDSRGAHHFGVNMENKKYILDVVDAEDGSEDKMLQFSEEFLVDHDWRPDDVISFDVQEDKSIILKNKTWEARNESLSKQIPLPLDQPLHNS